jgi:hypothetical protein
MWNGTLWWKAAQSDVMPASLTTLAHSPVRRLPFLGTSVACTLKPGTSHFGERD